MALKRKVTTFTTDGAGAATAHFNQPSHDESVLLGVSIDAASLVATPTLTITDGDDNTIYTRAAIDMDPPIVQDMANVTQWVLARDPLTLVVSAGGDTNAFTIETIWFH